MVMTGGSEFTRVDVLENGNVILVDDAIGWVSLSGISFPADA